MICVRCATEKDDSGFPPKTRGAIGVQSTCKACRRAIAREWRLNHLEHVRSSRASHYAENRDRIRAAQTKYRTENAERCRQVRKDYYEANREAILEKNKRSRDRMLSGKSSSEYMRRWTLRHGHLPSYRIPKRIRCQVHKALVAANVRKGGKTFDLLGYSPADLMRHLERQFTRGMSWENYGEWHIDHIIPLASFNITSESDVAKAWSLPNLRPLWSAENASKKDKRTHLI